MSRDELIVVVARQAGQIAQLVEANEALPRGSCLVGAAGVSVTG